MPASDAPSPRVWLAFALVIVAGETALWFMGRPLICACGTVKFWHGDIYSAENSQHLTDWYTFSHIVHGFLFYGLFALARRVSGRALALGAGLLAAVVAETGWEALENSNFIIDRYRATTIALGYNGDSIVNSTSDILAMTAGFLMARALPVGATLALAAAMELGLAATIRDNLTLNIIMLIHPFEAVKAWQAAS